MTRRDRIHWRPVSIGVSGETWLGVAGTRGAWAKELFVYLAPNGEIYTGNVAPFTMADVNEGANLLRKKATP